MSKIEELQKEELVNKARRNPYHHYEAYLEEYKTHSSQIEGEMRGKKFKQLTEIEAGVNIHQFLNKTH